MGMDFFFLFLSLSLPSPYLHRGVVKYWVWIISIVKTNTPILKFYKT